MWNYNFVFPSLMVLVVFLIYYFCHARLPIRKNRTFLGLLLVDIGVILTDIVSSRADEMHEQFSIPALYVLNMAFFVLFLARIFCFYHFTEDVLRLGPRERRWLRAVPRLIFLLSEIIALSSFFTGAVFRIDSLGYHRGPLYDVLYVCFFSHIALSAALALIYRDRVSLYELINLLAYDLILLAGNVARILMPQHLIMNTFCLLSIIIIYLGFENPDLYVSDRGTAFNMRAFREVLEENGARRPYRILGFVLQDYNDQRGVYGGAQMDQGITLISQYLSHAFPANQVFYLRSGCFALLGPQNMDYAQARAAIVKRFSQPWEADGADLYLTPSFVLADHSPHLDSADRIINALLIALDHVSKPTDAVLGWNEEEAIGRIDQQIAARRALEKAMEEDTVEVFLQPLVDSGTGRVIAAEALARIRDGQGGLISPAMFIPIAEKSGHISLLGEQVFEKVCRFIREQDMDRMGLQWINVNLSPIQCMRNDLAPRFDDILRRWQVDARRIHLEITEQSMIDFSLQQKQLDALLQAGFCFALDDYGSGYSNLSRVRQAHFSNIKLDIEVVRDYCRERDKLLPSVVQSFKQMGYTVTAEGIESADMAEALRAIGCDYLQGFYFSQPVPMEEFAEKYGASA